MAIHQTSSNFDLSHYVYADKDSNYTFMLICIRVCQHMYSRCICIYHTQLFFSSQSVNMVYAYLLNFIYTMLTHGADHFADPWTMCA